LTARQAPRQPAYDPNALAIDGGLTLFASIRDSAVKEVELPAANGHVEVPGKPGPIRLLRFESP
jgi:hypothetical protein